MSNLHELEKAEGTAMLAFHEAEAERRKFVHRRREEVEEEANRLYDDRIVAARTAYRDARIAVEEERERVALTGANAPYPLGTKLYKWELIPTDRWSRTSEWKVTATGVMEAITRASEHPGNAADYSRAKIGQFVVRLYKKDGTLGARYDTEIKKHWSSEGWYPDGKNHPKEEETA